MAKSKSVELEVGDQLVTVTNPDKVFFPERGYTKLDIVRYFIAVGEGALRGVHTGPMVLKRFVNGVSEEPFFQKRAPANLPGLDHTARITFPSGRCADLVVCDELADLVWVANLGCVDLNPWPVRADDVDHPDELRVDLDPTPEATFADVREVRARRRAKCWRSSATAATRRRRARAASTSTCASSRSGSSAMCAAARSRSAARWSGACRSSPRRSGGRKSGTASSSTTTRTRATAPSPRRTRSAPTAGRARLLPARLGRGRRRRPGGVHDRDRARSASRSAATRTPRSTTCSYSLEPLLELVARHEREGQGDAPWPPQFPKAAGEPKRVQPSRARREPDAAEAPATATERDSGATGRRQSVHPLITIAQAEHKDEALAGLERWKARHPEAAPHLKPADILVDSMRGSSSTWTRIRVNLRNVPEDRAPRRGDSRPRLRPVGRPRPVRCAAARRDARTQRTGDARRLEAGLRQAAAASSRCSIEKRTSAKSIVANARARQRSYASAREANGPIPGCRPHEAFEGRIGVLAPDDVVRHLQHLELSYLHGTR